VLVLEGKRRSGLRRLHVGLVGFVTGSVLGAILYQTFEHEDEHEHALVRQRDTSPDEAVTIMSPWAIGIQPLM
jgi:hypothetical protein